ncbi:DNA-processing protein DprA [Neisseria dentiae]|nr:DNA-processing protein DprA [Neisseria dentiae]MCQ9327101.1 DNA-processing protein DprA [Neisseria dentiae]
MNDSERYAWIQLALTPYVGAESFLALIRHYGSARAALAAPAETVRKLVYHKQAVAAWEGDNAQATAAAEAALAWEKQEHCRLMLLGDSDFPQMLAEGITPPPLLFLRGRSELLHRPAVAIVGSRHATPQAVRIARDFGQALSEKGITVVSGMASGIDTAAHQGALQANGGTVAVWGTGIDRIYPQTNKALAYQIAEQGLVISEFPLGTRPLAGNFPRRNRLIAALSQAVLVVEAAPESGSLITAKLAAEMGREVMAVPGSIDNPHSKGCHKLIKEGAKLVECLDDIVQECPQLLQYTPPERPAQQAVRNTAQHEENAVAAVSAEQPAEHPLLTALGYSPAHPDSLAQALNLPAAEIYAQLLELELANQIAALPGGRYQRVK